MDRAEAARLEKAFASILRAVAEDTYEPEGALDEYRPAGIMPRALLPDGFRERDAIVAVQNADGRNHLIPFDLGAAEKVRVHAPLAFVVEWRPKVKPTQAVAANDRATVRNEPPDKSEAGKPAAKDAFRVSVGTEADTRHRQRQDRLRAEAAKRVPPEPTPAEARERLGRIARGTLGVPDAERRRLVRIASKGMEASASAFRIPTPKDRTEGASSDADRELRSARYWARRGRLGGDE